MKRTTAIALFALASLIPVGGAFAQSTRLQANVPFDFTVGGTTLPSGTYTVSSPSSHIVLIQNRDHSKSVIAMSSNAEGPANRSKMVFKCYGNQHFLREVLSPTTSLNVEFREEKAEKRAEREQVRLAENNQVEIAAK